jgi:hypothetical protein
MLMPYRWSPHVRAELEREFNALSPTQKAYCEHLINSWYGGGYFSVRELQKAMKRTRHERP